MRKRKNRKKKYIPSKIYIESTTHYNIRCAILNYAETVAALCAYNIMRENKREIERELGVRPQKRGELPARHAPIKARKLRYTVVEVGGGERKRER